MKNILILLIISTSGYSQHIAYRQSSSSYGVSMSIPLNTQSKGSLFMIMQKERTQNVAMVNYVEGFNLWKFNIFVGAGVHIGNRQAMNWKRDGNTIFLAGVCAIGGIKYTYNNVFISADITPRVDLPLFGGCEMHRYCGESSVGSVNFSIGLNLKQRQ